MSLLEALKNKKKSLKNTDTIITRADGRRFIENNQGIRAISNTTGFVIDTKPDNIPALVTANIYLGSQDCCEEDILLKYNISYVLSIGVTSSHKYPNIDYNFIECLDLPETDIIKILRLHCIPYIKNSVNQCKNILIHCNAGVSRSSAIVIGYLMLEYELEYNIAYDMVKQVRPCIKPNIGFEKQLVSLNK